jgi:Zn-finger nucleic acid-binding protein
METAMRCPVDNETLVMADRGGVEIDYCPKCRGVWLDRGELDKIIERSIGASPAPIPAAPPPRGAAPVYQPEPQRAPPQGYAPQSRRDHDDDDDDYRHGNRKKRRDSFLSDLFDF